MAMKPETDDITSDEWLLRRVHGQWFPRKKGEPFRQSAFAPRDPTKNNPDHNGISFHRLDCVAAPVDVLGLIEPTKRKAFGIVRVQVCEFLSANYSVERDPDDNPDLAKRILGHVVIPEINTKAYWGPDDIDTELVQFVFGLNCMAKDPSRIVIWPDYPGIWRP
jgi:hypothetical protein